MNDARRASSALESIIARERARYAATRPQAARIAGQARAHWLNGVPMHWMTDWGLPFPLIVREAQGAQLTDVDGNVLADFCLGDTGAMFGHSPPAVAAAIQRQSTHGLTYMLPSELLARAGELLAQRFGLPFWQMTQTATDANRAVLRWARALTGRGKILVFDGCYHGSLEEALVHLENGAPAVRRGQVGAHVDFAAHARIVEFNDLDALERELAHQDVACVLAEPIMTNAGMVLAQPEFWSHARRLCTRYGALLAIDETHTLSSGPHGHAHAIELAPDFLVIGKAIAGGLPCAVYGCTEELAARMSRILETKPSGHSGMGTTLAANALALAALVACLEQVMTQAAYAHMLDLSATLRSGLTQTLQSHGLPWSVTSLGARSELSFSPQPPRTAREALTAGDARLEHAIHLFLLNRGALITPFHNMMLVSPAATREQLQVLLDAFAECCSELASLFPEHRA